MVIYAEKRSQQALKILTIISFRFFSLFSMPSSKNFVIDVFNTFE